MNENIKRFFRITTDYYSNDCINLYREKQNIFIHK